MIGSEQIPWRFVRLGQRVCALAMAATETECDQEATTARFGTLEQKENENDQEYDRVWRLGGGS